MYITILIARIYPGFAYCRAISEQINALLHYAGVPAVSVLGIGISRTQ